MEGNHNLVERFGRIWNQTMNFVRHVLGWVFAAIVMVGYVCPDLQPNDQMFWYIGNVSRFVFWVYHVFLWFGIVYGVLRLMSDEAEDFLTKRRMPSKTYSRLLLLRRALCVMWLVLFGHWIIGVVLMIQSIFAIGLVATIAMRKVELEKRHVAVKPASKFTGASYED